MDRSLISASLLTLLLSFSSFHFVDSTTFKIVNKCRHTIWPGILTGANRTVLTPTGFTLEPGKSRTLTAPKSWSGRLWARTICSHDSSGKFSCATADCGSGMVECAGAGAIPPATLAEFTLNGDQGLDFYDVSLVDGYNLPILVITVGGTSGGCSSTGCLVDLNGGCPTDLRVARGNLGVACRSACEAFGDPQYCCSEGFSTPDTCQPSVYSQFFKHACPRSYSYAYDDKTSTFTCAAADYLIIFCPLPYTSEKLLELRRETAELPLVNKTMMYIGHQHSSGGGTQNLKILNGGFSVVAAAATGNEIVKESFMDLKIDELMIQILRTHGKGCIHSLYDAIQALLTPDDNRVVASQVYGYARRFAKIGIAEALVDLLKEGLSSPSLVSATMTLKAVAVNDEICRSIAASGGVDAVLRCIGDSGEQGNKIVARACCSLLSKLAGSDTNKSAIIEKGGMDRIIKLSARFFDDPSVLQEVMSIICVLSLRSPDNAARAIEAGAGDLVIQAMQRHPGAHQMQKSACMMIRNLVARNPENRTLLLNNGIEKIIRKAKENHTSCKDAATDALRDLGLDNYNL